MAGIGITIEGLSKSLGPVRVLDSLSAEFRPGSLNGLIGPDGAGKTTLMRLVTGLLRADSGRVSFREGDREAPFAEVRPLMAYMPQQQSLYPDLSVGEHLDFFRDLYRVPARVYAPRRERLLGMARLGGFVDRPAGQLSGGMYKKLGLMCALLQSPRVVLLDEPTNGVDPISRREFWDLLYGLVAGGILVVVSTAYMDEAERCGSVLLLEDGRMLASGEPREVLAREGAAGFEELFLRRAGEPA
jgi:ABC-2 type transport system ATP-binding protein